MIESYWNEMFGEFKTGDQSFELPEFPEPLMSPHFGKNNIVGPCMSPAKLCLKLCSFRPSQIDTVIINVEKLEDVIGEDEFWQHQKDFHSDSFSFIRRLLPFLVTNQKPHYYFYIRRDGEIMGTAIGGEGESKCLLFNLNVREEFRGNGVARQILTGARNFFSEKEVFYWTIHPGFTLGADYVEDYYLI